MILPSLFLVVTALAAPSTPSAVITLDPKAIIRKNFDQFHGINLNYIRDSDKNRPTQRPLEEALSEMRVKWMRYPGGEKSDFTRWSVPPYTKPNPVGLNWYASPSGVRMDFDDFMLQVRAQKAEPYLVVGYDNFSRSGLSEDQYLQDAVAWVRYANVVKKYRVKRWEIGNENWHNGTTTGEEMARVVKRFASAMKAVDSTILVGASCSSSAWNDTFLPLAAPSLDFVSVSQYIGWEWKSYLPFLSKDEPELTESIRRAVDSILKLPSKADRDRLKVIVTEINTKDYSTNGWPDNNDIGHALPTFTALGRLAENPKVDAAMVWNTRWVKDDEAPKSMFYALDTNNRLTFTGMALRMWGSFIKRNMIATKSSSPTLAVFGARDNSENNLSLWVVNRSTENAKAVINVNGFVKTTIVGRESLTGSSPQASLPILTIGVGASGGEVTFAPMSITAFQLKGQRQVKPDR